MHTEKGTLSRKKKKFFFLYLMNPPRRVTVMNERIIGQRASNDVIMFVVPAHTLVTMRLNNIIMLILWPSMEIEEGQTCRRPSTYLLHYSPFPLHLYANILFRELCLRQQRF